MNATNLFPALLALMIAVLTALGYALHRLANTSSQFTLPQTRVWPCAHCGGNLAGGLSHCPLCGAPQAATTEASGFPHQDDRETSSGQLFPRSR